MPERRERGIGPGARLLEWRRAAGPQWLQAVEADLGSTLLGVGISVGRGDALGLQPLSQQVSRLAQPGRQPIAAVNADFFFYPSAEQPGIPTGATVLAGEVIRTPFPRSALILRPGAPPSITLLSARGSVSAGERAAGLDMVNQPRRTGALVLYTPWFGAGTRTNAHGTEVVLEPEDSRFRHGVPQGARVVEVRPNAGNTGLTAGRWVLSGSGDAAGFLDALKADQRLELRLDFEPALGPEDQVVAGGPRLVRDGKAAVEAEGGTLGGAFASMRHPRTAVGLAGKRLVLLVVDGRQPGHSVGMSLTELAEELVALGCTDGLNLDGGGSTTLWVRGVVLNRPSDRRERPVANGLVLFSAAPQEEPVRLTIMPTEIRALAGARVKLVVKGEDQHFNPTPLPAPPLRWELPAEAGSVENVEFRAAPTVTPPPGDEAVSGQLEVTAGALSGRVTVRVYPKPAQVFLSPAVIRVKAGSHTALEVRAYDTTGNPLELPDDVRWEADPALGQVGPDGILTAGREAGKGAVRVTVAGVTAEAPGEVSADR